MPRHQKDSSVTDLGRYRATFGAPRRQNDNAPAPNMGTEDEIEFLREGGYTKPDQDGLENMSTPGTSRTYSGGSDADGDNDFDSTYGDDEKMFNDSRAEDRFMRGVDEDSDYASGNSRRDNSRKRDRRR